MADQESILERHLVSKGSAKPIYRDSHDRRHYSPNSEYRFNNDVPNRLLEQTRLSILNWNPGPRRGKEGAIEKHIAEKWHRIALQDAIEYLQHEYLTSHFHVTHYAECAILFNKDTFHHDIKVSSIYLHDTGTGAPTKKRKASKALLIRVRDRVGDFSAVVCCSCLFVSRLHAL